MMKYQNGRKYGLCLLTLSFFGSVAFLHIPTTQTRYYDDEDNALLYKTNLYSLYKGTLGLSISGESNYRDIVLRATFSRNNVVTNQETDVYEIVSPSGCSISRIVSVGNAVGNQITYQGPGTDNISVDIRCPLTQVTNAAGEIRIPISVKEKVGNEVSFLYRNRSFLYPLDAYHNKYPIPTVSASNRTITIPSVAENRYSLFLEKMSSVVSKTRSNIDSGMVLNYVKSVYSSESSLFDLNKTLPGLQVSKKKGNLHDEYIYTIEDSFFGYLLTYANRTKNSRVLYFTSTVSSEIEKAFSYYLKQYVYSKDSYFVPLVLDYVKQNGGISSVILPGADGNYKQLLGFTYDKKLGTLTLDSILDDIVTPTFDTPIPIRYGTSLDMKEQFSIKLPKAFGPEMISEAAISEVLKNKKMIESIQKGNTDSNTLKNFHDQYLYYDLKNNHYLLFDISSFVENDSNDTFNYVDLTKIPFKKDEVMFQNLEDGMLEVTVKSFSKEEILKKIKELNELLNVSILDQNLVYDVKKQEDGKESYSVTYLVPTKITMI